MKTKERSNTSQGKMIRSVYFSRNFYHQCEHSLIRTIKLQRKCKKGVLSSCDRDTQVRLYKEWSTKIRNTFPYVKNFTISQQNSVSEKKLQKESYTFGNDKRKEFFRERGRRQCIIIRLGKRIPIQDERTKILRLFSVITSRLTIDYSVSETEKKDDTFINFLVFNNQLTV